MTDKEIVEEYNEAIAKEKPLPPEWLEQALRIVREEERESISQLDGSYFCDCSKTKGTPRVVHHSQCKYYQPNNK